MKKIFLSIIASLLLSQIGSAQSNLQNATKLAGGESATQQAASTQNTELDEASRLSQAVVNLYKEGKYDEALPLAKRALEIREKALGPENESVASALINLGELYSAKKKYGDAIPPLERALAIKGKQSPPDTLAISALLSKLAYLSYMKGDKEKTETYYQRAIFAKEQALGPDDLEVAKLLVMLADVYRFTGKPQMAEQTYERAVTIYTKKLKWKDPDLQHALDRYSCLYMETAQYDKVKELTQRIRMALEPNSKIVVGGVLNGKAVSLPKPEYPGEARAARVSGAVVVKVTIDETGNVIEASDLCGGHPLLVKPSLKAAREAKFTPTLFEGTAVKVTGIITYNFVPR
jgi:TonB family protein